MLPLATRESEAKPVGMANVGQLMQLQTEAAYKRPLREAGAPGEETSLQSDSILENRTNIVFDLYTVTIKRLKLSSQGASLRATSIAEDDELLMENSSDNDYVQRSAISRSTNRSQAMPLPQDNQRTRTRLPVQIPSAEVAMQGEKKTQSNNVFEDLQRRDERKPQTTETQWKTDQYREDKDGVLWRWTGKVENGRKVFVPVRPGMVIDANEELSHAE